MTRLNVVAGRIAKLGPSTWAICAIILLFSVVVVARPTRFYFDDSYFYFQVAWNFAHGAGSTFNGIIPTNGYHPLWMLICSVVFLLVHSKSAALYAIAVVICLCDFLELAAVASICNLVADGTWYVAFLLAVPFDFLSQLGTEGAVSGLLLALAVLFSYRFVSAPTSRSAVCFHVAAALSVLARLDSIFVIGALWLASSFAVRGTGGRTARVLNLKFIWIYVVSWGAYVASNLYYFDTVQPISGLLKVHSATKGEFGSNIPHTGWIALAVMAACLPVVALRKRDLFFRVIEVPFAFGVVCHALYIALFMSNETRWSWYYTSWILLASLLLARAASLVVEPRGRAWLSHMWLSAASLLALVIVWTAISYPRLLLPVHDAGDVSAQMLDKSGVKTVFTFDKPGRLAYLSHVRVIPLDALMGDVHFERELAKGVNAYVLKNRVDGFIGPPVPFDRDGASSICRRTYLDSVEFFCAPTSDGTWMPTKVEVFSRMTGADAGPLALKESDLLSTQAGEVSIWRLEPDVRLDPCQQSHDCGRMDPDALAAAEGRSVR